MQLIGLTISCVSMCLQHWAGSALPHDLQYQGVFVWLCHEDAVCYKGCCGLCVERITDCGGSLPSGCEVYNLSVLLLFISLILLIHPACQTVFPSGDMFLFHSIPKHGLLWQGTPLSNLLRRFFEVFSRLSLLY